MPLPLIQDREPEGDFQSIAPQYSTGGFLDSLAASAELGYESSMVGAGVDLYVKSQIGAIKGQRTMDVGELTEKYPGVPWSGPQKEGVAEYIADEHRKRQRLQQRIELAGGGNGAAIANFATQIFVGAPENMIAGLGVGGLLRGAGIKMGTTLGARLGWGFAENVVGSLPIEAAIVARDRELAMDLSLTDSIKNIVYGSAGGVALHEFSRLLAGAVRGEYHLTGRARKVSERIKEEINKRFDPVERAQIAEVAAQQIAEGKTPTLGPIIQAIRQRMAGEGPRPGVDYSGRAQQSGFRYFEGENIQTTLFTGTDGRVEVMGHRAPVDAVSDGTYFGRGQTGTSDIFYENAASVEHGGVVHQFDVNGRFLSADDLIPQDPAVRKIFSDFLQEAKLDKLREAIDEISPREVYDNLSRDQVDQLNSRLREAGYDGIHAVEGGAGNERNFFHVFPERAPDVVNQTAALENDPRFTREMSQDEWRQLLEAHEAPENDLFHNQEILDRTQEQLERAKETDYDDPKQVEEALNETIEMANMMIDEGSLSPEGKALLDEINNTSAKPEPKSAVEPDTLSEAIRTETERMRVANENAANQSLIAEHEQLWRQMDELDKRLLPTDEHNALMNPMLDRLTEIEAQMSQAGIPLPLFYKDSPNSLRASAETGAPIESSAMGGARLRVDMEPLQTGEARAYKATRTMVGEPFTIVKEVKQEFGRSMDYLFAYDKHGNRINSVSFYKSLSNDRWHVNVMSAVDSEWRGSGVGEAMYRELNILTEGKIRPDASGSTSSRAWASWKKNLPENLVAHVNEQAQRIIARYGHLGREQVLRNAKNFGYDHVGRDVAAAVEEQLAGRKWAPDFAKEVPYRLASLTADVPLAPGEIPLKDRVKAGESAIKALYSCIGGKQ